MTCSSWQLDDADHDGGAPDANNFNNAEGLQFEMFYVLSGQTMLKSVSYLGPSGESGEFVLPAGNITIVAVVLDEIGGGRTATRADINIFVNDIDDAAKDGMIDDPGAALQGMSPDNAMLSLNCLAEYATSGVAARRHGRHRRDADSLGKQLEQVQKLIAETNNQLSGANLTASLVGQYSQCTCTRAFESLPALDSLN